MTIKKHIPNLLTSLNLFSGCVAIVMAFQGNFLGAAIWVLIGAVFDFFDGFAARLLHVPSPIGKELDSLADVVSFGVAPAMTAFILFRDYSTYPLFLNKWETLLPYTAFLIPMFSALRLAKFNLDERQTDSFLGLPTPANALFWVSYCYGVQALAPVNSNLIYSTLGFVIVLSSLMISEIPMFSFKIKKISYKGNEKQAILIILMIAFVALWGIIGIAWGILAYIALSITSNRTR